MKQSEFNFEDLKIAQFGMVFNQLNRDLTCSETANQWDPAILNMRAFLDILDQEMLSKPEIIANNHVESSRAFSMLSP